MSAVGSSPGSSLHALAPARHAALRAEVAAVMERNWQPDAGYTAPNDQVYPWQWLWDSCFHAVIWTELGHADRARRELHALFSTQSADGFVPHMNYQRDPEKHASFWGRRGSSSITQPPMFGHAVAQLVRAGVDVADALVEAARRGLQFLFEMRARDAASGLVLLCHPWETGADNSPRWDVLLPDGHDPAVLRERKGQLVRSITVNGLGSPIANAECVIASVAFNALLAFNALELCAVAPDAALHRCATDLAARLDRRFDAQLGTWADAGVGADGSGRVRTTEALLPLLVTADPGAPARAARDLFDSQAYGAAYGPRGVHVAEPAFDPGAYWRGSTWPQIGYLLWIALQRRHENEAAAQIARVTVESAWHSGWAEYWNPETGQGLGAIPQSWTGLALLMACPA